jgi:hypothetical protein
MSRNDGAAPQIEILCATHTHVGRSGMVVLRLIGERDNRVAATSGARRASALSHNVNAA